MISTARTPRKHQALQITLERLASALQPHALVLVIDPVGVIIEANQRACDLLGRAVGDLIGRNQRCLYRQLVSLPPLRGIRRALRAQRDWRGMMEIKAGSGTRIRLDVSVARSGPDGVGDACYIVFATPMATSVASADSDLSSRVLVLATALHDINNALASVVGYGELALRVLKDNDLPRLHRYVHAVVDAALHGRSVAARTAKAEAMLAPAASTVLMLEAQLTATLALVHAVLPSSIEIHLDAAANARAEGLDAMSLQQCLLNLSINARDALSRGGHISFRSVGGRHVEATCSACGAAFYGEFAEVACVDDGDGIPACSLSHVFEARFTSKSAESGHGLGLFSVNTAVHQAGGHIIIESEPGRGTSVRLLLRAPHT